MKIIAANWKMNKTNKEAKAFFTEYAKLVKQTRNAVIICAPFTTLATVAKAGKDFCFATGAQNFYPAKNGAFTGEVSLDMIADTGAMVVLVGHSERRTIFRETDEFINEKVQAALSAGFKVIFCIGETLAEREQNKTNTVLKKQITKGLKDVVSYNNLIVAYEPVWAIGTGKVATNEQIKETHAYIKTLVDVPLLYGGSVNEKNCAEIFGIPNVDGGLVGGASLVAEKFAVMVNYK